MLLLKMHTQAICDALNRLRTQRYRVLLINGGPLTGKSTLVREVCNVLCGAYYDVISELLPTIEKPVLGAYGPKNLIDWMIQKSEDCEVVLCVDEIEGLLSTFGEKKAKEFFIKLKEIEPRNNVIVVTRLNDAIAQSAFPKERIYTISG